MKFIFIAVLLLSLGCSTKQVKNDLEIPKSNNGAQVLYFENHELPLISMGWVIKSGSSTDPMSFSGLSNLTLSLWMDQPKLEEELKALGGSVSKQLTHDFAVVKFSCLSDKKEKMLEIAMKYLKKPVFEVKKFNHKKNLILSQMQSDLDNAEILAALQFEKEIYGAHPYGRRVQGTLREIQNITFDQVKKRFQDWVYVPNMVFYTAGDFDEVFKKNYKDQLESMGGGLYYRTFYPKLVNAQTPEIKVYDKADSNQSFVFMGHASLSRNDEDYLAMQIASLILGNLSTSRLNSKIRIEKGLTYSIQSVFDADAKAGHFEVSCGVKNENVGLMISESMIILNDFVKNGVTNEEVETAKNFFISSYLRETETIFDRSVFTIIQEIYGLPKESIEQSISKINSIGISEINNAIKRNIHPEQIKILVLGPKDIILPQVKSQGVVEIKQLSEL